MKLQKVQGSQLPISVDVLLGCYTGLCSPVIIQQHGNCLYSTKDIELVSLTNAIFIDGFAYQFLSRLLLKQNLERVAG